MNFCIEIYCIQVCKKISLKSSQIIPQRCDFKDDWKQTSPTPQPCYTKRGSCFGPRGTTEAREAAFFSAPPLYSSAQEHLPVNLSWHSQSVWCIQPVTDTVTTADLSAHLWAFPHSSRFLPQLEGFYVYFGMTCPRKIEKLNGKYKTKEKHRCERICNVSFHKF